MTVTTASPVIAEPRIWGARRIVLLHLVPGVPALIAYTFLAAALGDHGLPNLMALMLTSLLVEAPFLWWLMLRAEGESGTSRLRALFPWRAKLPWASYLLLGVPTLAFSFLMLGAVGPAVSTALLESAFAWVPEWFAMRADPEAMFGGSRAVVLAIWALSLLMVVVAGVTQELYFRGFLLPRMAHLGRRAPILNAALFAVFHMIAPWSWIVFFIGSLPWAALVYWKRSIRIGLFAHVGMLTLQWLGMTALAFGWIQMA